MMGFTLSRVALSACGILMLAAVLSPVNMLFEDGEDARLQEQSDRIAEVLSSFSESQTDMMFVHLDGLLPTADSTIIIDGSLLRMSYGGKEYVSALRYEIEDLSGPYGAGDTVELVRLNGTKVAAVNANNLL